jgi:hypothetical protein
VPPYSRQYRTVEGQSLTCDDQRHCRKHQRYSAHLLYLLTIGAGLGEASP